ncbi:hypothetical protein KKA17_01055 [bacterium]|nr:hypothetical protein [bacterium]MBU1882888.1 hypothetical protein [bacterium]
MSYIGAPLSDNRTTANNLLEFPLYINQISKQDNKLISVKKITADWQAIHWFYIGQEVLKDGSQIELENHMKAFEGIIHTTNIHIPNPKKYQVRTMKEFFSQTNYRLYEKFNNIEVIQDDLIYTYIDHNGYKIHIPAMETLRHFYVDSHHNTFLKNIFMPNAMDIGNMYRIFREIEIPIGYTKAYYLLMDPLTKKDDRFKLAYFLHKDEFKNMFNNVWYAWNNKGIIESPIPSDKSIHFEARYRSTQDGILILRIYRSTLLNFDRIKLNCKHPNDYDPKTENKRRDKKKDIQKNLPGNTNNNVSTKEPINPNNLDFNTNRPISLYNDLYGIEGLSVEDISAGKQEDRGGRVNYVKTKSTTLSTSSEKSSQGDGTSVQETEENAPKDEKAISLSTENNIQEIIQDIVEQGYSVISVKSQYFKLPDCNEIEKDDDGNTVPCTKAEAYIDVKKKIRRKYTLFQVKLSGVSEDLFCLDVAPKGKQKHMLLLFADCDFKDYLKIVDDLTFKQVTDGNHLWLKDNKLPKHTRMFERLRHHKTAEGMAKKIIKTIKSFLVLKNNS